ncbi:MAG: hypothetical protein J6J26_08180 [Bacteroides sp.]|nr:hypothetical protein [Bacteroides sp.]
MDKHKKEFHKYGFMTMIGWNILLVILVFIGSMSKHVSPNYIFDDGTGGRVSFYCYGRSFGMA